MLTSCVVCTKDVVYVERLQTGYFLLLFDIGKKCPIQTDIYSTSNSLLSRGGCHSKVSYCQVKINMLALIYFPE